MVITDRLMVELRIIRMNYEDAFVVYVPNDGNNQKRLICTVKGQGDVRDAVDIMAMIVNDFPVINDLNVIVGVNFVQ